MVGAEQDMLGAEFDEVLQRGPAAGEEVGIGAVTREHHDVAARAKQCAHQQLAAARVLEQARVQTHRGDGVWPLEALGRDQVVGRHDACFVGLRHQEVFKQHLAGQLAVVVTHQRSHLAADLGAVGVDLRDTEQAVAIVVNAGKCLGRHGNGRISRVAHQPHGALPLRHQVRLRRQGGQGQRSEPPTTPVHQLLVPMVPLNEPVPLMQRWMYG